MDDAIAFVVFIVGAIVVGAMTIFLLCALWAAYPGPKACEAWGDEMHVKTVYRFWYGCFVTMPDGQVLPESIAVKVLQQKYGVEVINK
jgi:hypothetical protein